MSGSVERALQILVELAEGPATISDLGRRLEGHASGAVCAAVSISVPRMVLEREELLALVFDLQKTADAISEELRSENRDPQR